MPRRLCGRRRQPIHDGRELAGERGDVLWGLDAASEVRFSHENPSVKLVYDDYLEHPLSERAEELLHTNHTAWSLPYYRQGGARYNLVASCEFIRGRLPAGRGFSNRKRVCPSSAWVAVR